MFQFPVGDAQKVLSDAIKDSVPVADIFYAFSALKNLGLQGKLNCIHTCLKTFYCLVFFI